MSFSRTTITLAIATALGLMGCGGSGSSSSQGTSVEPPGAKPIGADASATTTTSVKPPGAKRIAAATTQNAESPHAQFLAFANAVNLTREDVAGFVSKPKHAEHGSELVNSLKDKARYERCLGVGKEDKPIFKRSSEKFEAGRGLRYLSASSEVQVARTKALADKELTVARGVLASPTKRGCLAQAFDAMLGGSHTVHTRGHALQVTIGNTRVASLPVGAAAGGTSGGFGMSLSMHVTYALSVHGRRFTVQGVFYLDSLNFIVGRASVGLTTMTLGEPFSPEREGTLFTLLVARAITASGRSPAING